MSHRHIFDVIEGDINQNLSTVPRRNVLFDNWVERLLNLRCRHLRGRYIFQLLAMPSWQLR
jgi:hypothetical protein